MTSPLADLPDRASPAHDDDDHNKPKHDPEQTADASRDEHGGHDGHDDHNERGQEQHDEYPMNEHSPLLSPTAGVGEDDGLMDGQPAPAAAAADEHQKTKSIWYIILLTVSIGGLQIAWSVEMSNGSPYLLSLGISKSLMALVWIAGPLSGTLVQPYVGMLSDNCRIPWGKRKPFMIGGTVATIISLMFLAWTKESVGGFLGLFGAAPDSDVVKYSVIVIAVLWVYILDFAINTGRELIWRWGMLWNSLVC